MMEGDFTTQLSVNATVPESLTAKTIAPHIQASSSTSTLNTTLKNYFEWNSQDIWSFWFALSL